MLKAILVGGEGGKNKSYIQKLDKIGVEVVHVWPVNARKHWPGFNMTGIDVVLAMRDVMSHSMWEIARNECKRSGTKLLPVSKDMSRTKLKLVQQFGAILEKAMSRRKKKKEEKRGRGRPRFEWSDEIIGEIHQKRQLGVTWKEISNDYGAAESTIRKAMDRHRLEKPELFYDGHAGSGVPLETLDTPDLEEELGAEIAVAEQPIDKSSDTDWEAYAEEISEKLDAAKKEIESLKEQYDHVEGRVEQLLEENEEKDEEISRWHTQCGDRNAEISKLKDKIEQLDGRPPQAIAVNGASAEELRATKRKAIEVGMALGKKMANGELDAEMQAMIELLMD
jgi:DNA repair exonuclease SbcCD ATPase subunit